DLLGLGMLTALHGMVDLVRSGWGTDVDLATLPQEDAVYEMLSRADSVGVFQVESRAQMATLPRLAPRCFYDLVVEVALIRPGPIQGGSVHPYLRRRNGEEPVTYLHPLLERSLAKTLGVPMFQEQLMQMSIDVAGFTAGEADQLRQAMGAKRSGERMERLRSRFYAGMAGRGIAGEVADAIWEKLAAFASFGFPESHAASFAYLVYASAWFKLRYPAAFLAGLLNAQPMGFWAPQSLVADARRHGVEVHGGHVNASAAEATLEWGDAPFTPAVRLGLSPLRTLGEALAGRVAEGRPYASIEDLVRRARPTQAQVEALATAGALDGLAPSSAEVGRPSGPRGRREAIWASGALAKAGPDRLAGVVPGVQAPALRAMTPIEEAAADLWSSGVTPAVHPVAFARERLSSEGVLAASELAAAEPGRRVAVAGVVTHRQRPSTAGGATFLNLEDESGLVNVICSKGAWARWRRVARAAPALVVRGRLERSGGALSVVAERIEELTLRVAPGPSRDYR
ncbi:MAG: OB-fold nucleic acid binding domain-containing protein, partial [Acidimicrobiales bacterium]